MENEYEKDATEDTQSGLLSGLEKKLYSRQAEIPKIHRSVLGLKRLNTKQEWEGEGNLSDLAHKERPVKSSPYVKLLFVSFFFFVIAAAVAGWNMFGNQNGPSANNVSLSVRGPVSIRGGDTLVIQVVIENKNPVPLSNVVVGAIFPDGARYPNNPSRVLDRSRKSIESVQPGELRTETINAILLGADNTKDKIDVYIEFGVNGVGSFKKTETFSVDLTTSPLTVRTQLLKDISSGQEMVLGIDVMSNSPAPINNGLLKVDYPKGFAFISADPSPYSGNNVWSLGTLTLGDIHHINIKGRIEGENGEQKVFRLYNGVASKNGSTEIGTTFSTLLSSVLIKKPFLNVDLLVNGSTDPDYVLNGDSLNVVAFLRNTLQDKIINSQVTVGLSGDVISRERVHPSDGGIYNGTTGIVSWDFRSTSMLAEIAAGEKSSIAFSLGLSSFVKPDNTVFKNPVIGITVNIQGNRVSESNEQKEITSLVTRNIKVSTTAELSEKNYFWSGPLQNVGLIPPKVGKETTYTIVWSLKNTVNDISGGKVVSKLPSYVRWVGHMSPEDPDLVYNSATGDIIWTLGKIPSGTGYEVKAREVAFQVGVTPVTSQVGTVPTVLNATTFTGTDDFTGAAISQKIPLITTALPYEPQALPISAAVKP